MKHHAQIKEPYYKIKKISFISKLLQLWLIYRSIYLHTQPNLSDTIIPHFTKLNEIYNILHSNIKHVIINCAKILTKAPIRNCV